MSRQFMRGLHSVCTNTISRTKVREAVMEIPVARTRVCLKDESGVFLVVWVDWDRRRVELLRVSNGDSHPLMEGVAFDESI